MKSWRGRLIYGGLTLVAIVLLVLAFLPDPIPVEVATTVRGPLAVTVEDEGETRVRDRFVLSAPITGRLSRIEMRPGDRIEAGTVVARLDPLPLDPRAREQAAAALEAALDTRMMNDAGVAQAEAALAQARRDRERAEELFEQDLVSRDFVEHTQLDELSREQEFEAAQLRADAAGHQVELARAALLAADPESSASGMAVSLRAPVSGSILRIPERSGRVIQAGETVLEVGDAENLEIVTDLLSTDAVKVEPGATMHISAWGGDEVFEARVRIVEPSAFTKVSALGVEEQRVNVVGDFLNTPGRLGDGYRVEVSIILWAGDDILKVPSSSIFRIDEAWHLFIVEGGRSWLRPVEVGHQGRLEVEILDGLLEGQVVVRHPTDRVQDGIRVAVE